ncbi:sugar phosphate isomerase/epimerase family protein [Fodinicurvata halophila]|uniref:Sugar phosphate isomerase/epimerase family protein n=1 Tax=Fodinicurvata halophila TaxID=1419723 RepID=A0ABV8UPG7_9PROT
MYLSLCNEVLRDLPFAEQCRVAAALGYEGLELAPFTFDPETPHELPAAKRREIRQIAGDHGLSIVGLHWLLVAPRGLSVTTSDVELRRRTVDVLHNLVELCAELGGRVLVHGSPPARRVEDAESPDAARANLVECLASVGEAARKAGVVYCIEPLAPSETALVNTVSEAVAIVKEIDNPALRTMIDTSAAGRAESEPVDKVIRDWWPSGCLAHVQVNDRNRRAAGQGEDRFGPILRALRDVGYEGALSAEPFIYEPDGPTTAAVNAGYLKGLLEILKEET